MNPKHVLLAVSAAVMAACGGGGGDSSLFTQPGTSTTKPTPTPAPTPTPTPTSQADGIWVGTTSNNRTVNAIVLNDGSYYILYSAVGQSGILEGVLQGTGTAKNGSFASSDGRDFSLTSGNILTFGISASYQPKKSFNGTAIYNSTGSPSLSFTSAYSAEYDKTPALSTIAGKYVGQSAILSYVEAETLTIDTNGALAGTGGSGCTFTGSATPRSTGNAYNVTITFGAAPCAYPAQTLSGVAYFDSTSKRLYATTLNSDRSRIAIFLGTKQ